MAENNDHLLFLRSVMGQWSFFGHIKEGPPHHPPTPSLLSSSTSCKGGSLWIRTAPKQSYFGYAFAFVFLFCFVFNFKRHNKV